MARHSFQAPPPDLAGAKPLALRLGTASYETPTWAKVLEAAARAMLDGAKTRKAALAAAKHFSWMGRSGNGMVRPCELESGVWIELNQGSHGILVRTTMLLNACGYPLDRAALEYEAASSKAPTASTRHEASPENPIDIPPAFFEPPPRQLTLFEAKGKTHESDGIERKREPYTAYPKRELYAALHEDRIPDDDFTKLLTPEVSYELLGVKLVHGTPVFALDYRPFFWRDSAFRRGTPVWVSAQWLLRDKAKLEKLLRRWKSKEPEARAEQEENLPTAERAPASDRSDTPGKRAPDHGRAEKIGAYAKRTLYAALSENRVPDDDFLPLSSREGTAALLGFSMSGCPLFSGKPIVTGSGTHSWAAPAHRRGNDVYVCMEWYERHRPNLEALLKRWEKKPMTNPEAPKNGIVAQIEEWFDGVFTSDEFLEYAEVMCGLETNPAAQAAQIRILVQHFIRLDRDRWISDSNFRRLSDWDDAKASDIAAAMHKFLGNRPFRPFASIDDKALSELPAVRLDGQALPWTKELAASVSALLVPAVHVANYGTPPQAMTALLVPAPVPDEDVLLMALSAYCTRNPGERSVDEAFAFLRENFIRSRFTKNLEADIRAFLSSWQKGNSAPVNPVPNPLPDAVPPGSPETDDSDDNEKLLADWADGVF